MKWKDEEIDKLFQKGADKVSFEYKPEYWEEFSASLPLSASITDLSDDALDNLFKENADQSSFEYNPKYFEEFSASLPLKEGISDLSDEELDAKFKESANQTSFEYKPEYFEEYSVSLPAGNAVADLSDSELDELFKESAGKSSMNYKPEFWEEFSASLPLMVPTEDVTDSEVDELYRESVEDLSFEYKQSYWNEMLKILKRRRRPDFLWFGFSGMFAAIIIYGIATEQSPLGNNIESTSISTEEIASHNNTSNEGTLDATNNLLQTHTPNSTIVNENDHNAVRDTHIGGKENTPLIVTDANPAGNDIVKNNVNEIQENNITPEISTNTLQDVASERLKVLAPSLESKSFGMNKLSQEVQEFGLAPLSLLNFPLSGDSLMPYPSNVRNISTTGLYIQGVGGISQSSITPSDFLSNSYGIGVGLQINRNNWSFGLGTNVIVEIYKDLHLTRIAKLYGFGSDFYKFDLHYQKLYVAELDLSLGYSINRHQFKAGIRPSYTFSSKVNIAETSVTSSKGLSNTETESRIGLYGFMDGIYQWGLKPNIGYAYNLKSNWTLGMNISTEIMPSINEEYINGVNNNLPIEGQLYIRKTFNLRK